MGHTQPSHLYNKNTQANFNTLKDWKSHFNYSQNVRNRLSDHSLRFRNEYRAHIFERANFCRGYYGNNVYRYQYSAYFNYGFCGGYYYPVRPWIEIDTYFYYPVIYWLYTDNVYYDPDYYSEWYGNDYLTYPVTPFSFAGVFLPTENLRDLAMDVNGMSAQNQANFRSALETALTYLVDEVSDVIQATFTLGDNDVVVTHYENLSDRAIVMEGFVDRGDIHVTFKAVLDLVGNSQTAVFVPRSADLSADDLARLEVVNNIIRSFGGNPAVVQGEPDPAPAPTP